MARRRTPPPVTEPPAWVRCFEPVDVSDNNGSRERWNTSRFAWCEANRVDPLDVLREQAETKRRPA